MLDSVFLFVKQILRSGGIRISEFPRKHYQALLTVIGSLAQQQVIFIPEILDLAKQCPGSLVVDDTNNPKYGLKRLTQTLLNLSTKGYHRGYKIVLFLWVTPQGLRLPLGFALWHKESKTPPELALEGFSHLRNQHGLKPQRVLGDGAYGTQEILKRLSDYGWPCIFRVANSRKLSGQQVRRLIPRGYGEVIGKLENGTTLKVVRSGKHFLASNRMMLSRQSIRGFYALRWKIEEVFRVLKSQIHLDGCQQHSIRAQAIYLILCLLLFLRVEHVSGGKPYSVFLNLNSRSLDPDEFLTPPSYQLAC